MHDFLKNRIPFSHAGSWWFEGIKVFVEVTLRLSGFGINHVCVTKKYPLPFLSNFP